MARKPPNFEWIGYTNEQVGLLNDIDFYGNNAWDRNGQSDELMPKLLAKCANEGLSLKQIVEAMISIGYDRRAAHQLKRWESKRLTGKFGK